MASSALGLDIGGANLKAAHVGGTARSQPFALWKNPGGLAKAIRQLLTHFSGFDLLAVTMTGELCDCFETKRQGVAAILDAVVAAAGDVPVRVWRTDGRFVDPAEARSTPRWTAAANWHALATFAGRFVPNDSALLIDIGSTTTDIIPLVNGTSVPRGRIDPQRLQCRELVYTGVRRTPLCALLGSQVAAELFATTLDAYLVLGDVAEDPADCDTADGRAATRAAAHARLARMLCADDETSTPEEVRRLAEQVRDRQLTLLRQAITQVTETLPQPPRTWILSGSGEFLARQLMSANPRVRGISLSKRLGDAVSTAACAYALAVLASERLKEA